MVWMKLLITVAASLIAGWIGSVFTMDAIASWYAALDKPPLTPPNWIFGPVWTALYVMMGLAAGLVWQAKGAPGKGFALGLFFAHLFVNAMWSIVFFTFESPGWALGVIGLLLLMIVALLVLFERHSRTAAYLLIPYLLWVSFASYLNAGIWWLN